MRVGFFAMLVQLLLLSYANAQIFQVDTIQYKGDINKYINIVIMGDGYTTTEQNKFITDSKNLSNYLFTKPPWSNYSNYFNVFAIKVISNQSGTIHPNTAGDCNGASPLVPISNPITYFGSRFDTYGIHRLVVPTNISNIVNVLSSNFPGYDQVLIIANSPYYGGSGGSFATSTTESSSPEITAHELGHSFSNLADEYYPGDIYAAEKPNMTKQTNPSLVKWGNWIGFNGIGIYQHCCVGQSALWYRPHNNCKMRNLGLSYCSVCTENIIETIHFLANPIVSYIPSSLNVNSSSQFIDFKLTVLMTPLPNTLNTKWNLDGISLLRNIDSIRLDQNLLTTGTHTLTATVIDTTSLVRVNNHSTTHFSVVSWTITKVVAGVRLTMDNKFNCSVFPNPSSGILNISVEPGKRSKLSIQIVSPEGKLIQQAVNGIFIEGKYVNTFNIEHLNNGTYLIVFKLGNITHTQIFIKQ
jgi:hypothetical protein